MKRHLLALAGLAVLTACSSTSTTSSPTPQATTPEAVPSSSMTPFTPPASVPPLGKDLACFDTSRCYLKNPTKRTDDQIIAWLPSVPGARQDPAPAMKPWAYVVLGIGDGQVTAHSAPREDAPTVGDEIGINNHRAVFAYCRATGDGRPVTASTPRKDVWLRIEPITAMAPAEVWVNGEHVHPYGHDGALPTC